MTHSTESHNAGDAGWATGLWSGAYVIGVFATSAIARALGLTGVAAIAAMAVPMLLLFAMVRAQGRRKMALGEASPALLAYNKRSVPIMMGFLLAMLMTSSVIRQYAPEGPLLVVLALVPALPMLGMIWSVIAYLQSETDEYLRRRYVDAMLIATGALFTVVTVWGFLETFAKAPNLPVLALLPMWGIALGIANVALKEPA